MDIPSLTLRQLRYLVALDACRHFRHAAEQCGVSQPSLSAQVQNAEETLGLRLVERSPRGVSITPEGREVVARAQRVLDEIKGIEDFAASARGGLAGTVRMGAKPTLGPYLLPHITTLLRAEHPDLKLYVREGAPRELEFELARGEHDLILAQLPVSGADLVTRRLFREPLSLALAADHPLAAEATIPVDRLAGLEVLSLSPKYHLHDQILELCKDFGARVQRDYEGTSLDALRTMVAMGMGVTFLPALYARSEIGPHSEVVVRPIKGRVISRSIGLVWRKSSGRAAGFERIANAIRKVAAERFPMLTLEG